MDTTEDFYGNYLNPLTPVPPVTARDEPWPFFLFWHHHFRPKLASSRLNFCSREEKIFPMMPRSEWSAQWSLRYAQKCSKSWVKNLEQNFLPLHLECSILKITRLTRSEVIWPRSSPKITKMSKKHSFCKKFQESMG